MLMPVSSLAIRVPDFQLDLHYSPLIQLQTASSPLLQDEAPLLKDPLLLQLVLIQAYCAEFRVLVALFWGSSSSDNHLAFRRNSLWKRSDISNLVPYFVNEL